MISSLKSRTCLFLSSLMCSTKSTSFLRGQGRDYGVQVIQFLNHSNHEFSLCWRLVQSYFSIVYPKAFYFCRTDFKQFACIDQLVMIVIMWFFRNTQSRNRPSSRVISLSHRYYWMCQANNHGWESSPVKSHYCTIIHS